MTVNVDDDGNVVESGEEVKDDSTSEIASLKEGLAGVLSTIQVLANGQQQFQQTLSEIANASRQPVKEIVPEPVIDDEDLDTMSRKDLIAHIQKLTAHGVEQTIKPILDQLKGLGSKVDESITSNTVQNFQKDHKDLMEWKAEIAEIFKSGRATNVNDAYRLARLDDGDKAKKIDLKYNPVSTTNVVTLGFKGFPSGSVAGSGRNTRMTPKQAADAAWEEATAQMPGMDQFFKSSEG
jgi:hypothetical protein